MHPIRDFMADDHRYCDASLAAVDQATAKGDWQRAMSEFASFHDALQGHFAAEELVLFPLFEQQTGSYLGPTQVMRSEHVQMRQLLAAAGSALKVRDADDYMGHSETLLIMLQQHNIKEENVLYPMCDQYLVEQVAELLPELRRYIVNRVDSPA